MDGLLEEELHLKDRTSKVGVWQDGLLQGGVEAKKPEGGSGNLWNPLCLSGKPCLVIIDLHHDHDASESKLHTQKLSLFRAIFTNFSSSVFRLWLWPDKYFCKHLDFLGFCGFLYGV